MRQTQRMASLIGKAGEHAVAAQLMVRGMGVYFPASDYGVDLIAENGCRIQVKSSHLAATEKMIVERGQISYAFPLRRSKRVAVSDSRSRLMDTPQLSSICDVIACWGIDQNRFWLIPATLADNTQLFILGPETSRNKFHGSIEDLKQMVSLGYTHAQIGKQYGITGSAITNILNRPGFQSQSPNATKLARACENAWENVLDFKKENALIVEPEFAAQEEI